MRRARAAHMHAHMHDVVCVWGVTVMEKLRFAVSRLFLRVLRAHNLLQGPRNNHVNATMAYGKRHGATPSNVEHGTKHVRDGSRRGGAGS